MCINVCVSTAALVCYSNRRKSHCYYDYFHPQLSWWPTPGWHLTCEQTNNMFLVIRKQKRCLWCRGSGIWKNLFSVYAQKTKIFFLCVCTCNTTAGINQPSNTLIVIHNTHCGCPPQTHWEARLRSGYIKQAYQKVEKGGRSRTSEEVRGMVWLFPHPTQTKRSVISYPHPPLPTNPIFSFFLLPAEACSSNCPPTPTPSLGPVALPNPPPHRTFSHLKSPPAWP